MWLRSVSIYSEFVIGNNYLKKVNNNAHNMFVNLIEVHADGRINKLRLRVVELVAYFAAPQVRFYFIFIHST